jgi:probable HAF family extracellular repeat protein
MRPRSLAHFFTLIGSAALTTACTDIGAPRPTADAVSAAIAVGAQPTVSVAAGSITFTITDLGVPTGGTYSSGYTINNLTQIVGMSSDAAGALAPLLWTGGSAVAIPNFDAAGLLIPVRINDAGHMILQENIGGTSIGYAIWREPNGTQHRLPSHPGGDPFRVYGRGINATGFIVGMTREPNLAITTHGVIWQNGAFVQDIGAMAGFQSTNPQDINDASEVVGTSTNTFNFNNTAFRWQSGTFTNLGALSAGAASSAYALNNTGTIVGTSNGGFPVRWVNGAIQSLSVPAGVIQPTPVDVNDTGDIVGWGTSTTVGALYASVLWRGSQAILLPTWPGATQTLARSINNNGEIVGEGNLVPGGPMHALLWKVSTGSPPPTNSTPVVTLTATSATTINAGSAVSMRGSFTDPDNGPWSYTFQWQDGTTAGSRSKAGRFSASHTYRTKGLYNVTLTVTDKPGAVGTSNVVQVTVR